MVLAMALRTYGMQKIWAVLLLIAALAAGGLVYRQLDQPAEFSHVLIYPTPRDLKPFSLSGHNAQPVGREQLNGHWTLAFVGYTFCPDICPMTMAMLAGSYTELSKALPAGQKLQLWFVSVDPKRDTVTQLGNYVGYFEQPAILGVTANHDQLFPFVRELGLMYAISSTTDDDYRVDHSASVVLINPHGQLVAMFKPELGAEQNTVPVVTKAQLLRDFPAVVQQVRP